ncbi:hypothetical protein Poly21_37960 [Allorhodopirellula heiligendammensis]|uniref:Uncharacterized protein n=1 Tax=Allorhodopirellula heiligendammensis TaxID=2714739 RepID=A0A5C6BYQ8_9BACT|nr:hypothetical protein Poly21_37960 [Allorhodopirellula heiligendammensis]
MGVVNIAVICDLEFETLLSGHGRDRQSLLNVVKRSANVTENLHLCELAS